MKYRFRVSERPRPSSPQASLPAVRRAYRLRGRQTLRPLLQKKSERIPLFFLLDLAALPEGRIKRKDLLRQRRQAARHRLTCRVQRLRDSLAHAVHILRTQLTRLWQTVVSQTIRRPPKEKTIHSLPVLCGFLCASLLVSILSAGGVLWGLFGGYHRPYTGVTIPDFVGQSSELILQKEMPYLNLIIEYESNPEIPAGVVITQSPRAGVTRRVYGQDGYCDIHLTVSKKDAPYQLENLIGMNQRDAILTLRNHNVSASVTQVYSDTVPKGAVLETIPPTGSTLSPNASVLLHVSAGAQKTTRSVPNLFGMTETEAAALLRHTGLTVGTVAYRSSPRAAGTVISQELAAYSSVVEGTAVSYTVSIGDRYWLPTVPDLYGLSLKEAEQQLRSHGLLVGTVHSLEGAAPKGTVITQSPLPGAPITSSTVSVELYVIS